MKVMIGAPVRNRAWVLPRHLDMVLKQKGVEIETCYIVNDSIDDTEKVLKNNGCKTVTFNVPQRTESEVRGKYSYNHLAVLRNKLLEEFLKSDCEYLFSCDTDIILPDEYALKRLLDNNKDVVSMIIRNHPTIMAHNVMIDYKHLKEINEGLMECTITGAVYAIHRSVIEAGVRYGYHRMGEDVYFCDQALNKGFKLYCDTRIQATHAYNSTTDLLPNVTKGV